MSEFFAAAELAVAPPPPQEKAQLPKFLTVSELVAATKISRKTISRKISCGIIPHTKVGSRILIPTSYLVALEQSAWSVITQLQDDVGNADKERKENNG